MAANTNTWRTFLATLDPKTRNDLEALRQGVSGKSSKILYTREAYEYDKLRAAMPPETQVQFDELAEQNSEPEPAQTADGFRYLLLECPDGEWSVIRSYASIEAVAKRMAQLEGTDTVVFPIWGVPLPFTKGLPRYLVLPNGRQAIQIPYKHGGPCQIVPADLLEELAIQQDGFLGPEELIDTATRATPNEQIIDAVPDAPTHEEDPPDPDEEQEEEEGNEEPSEESDE